PISALSHCLPPQFMGQSKRRQPARSTPTGVSPTTPNLPESRAVTTILLHPPPANFSAAHVLLVRLYREHRAFLRRVLLGQAIPPRDVEDVVQEVFITAWRRLECLVMPEQARPWLLVIGLNKARNHRKLARCEREVFVGLAEDLPEPEDPATTGMLIKATYKLLRLKQFLRR